MKASNSLFGWGIFNILLLIGLSFCGLSCSTSPQKSANLRELLANAPVIEGDNYKCIHMVTAVNELRHIGKERALEALGQYVHEDDPASSSENQQKVLLICRLLFVNTTGWKFPHLGQPVPDVNWHVAEQLPVFPIMQSDGVPFLVVRGYEAMGWSNDTAERCLQECKAYNLISADLPEAGYKHAAEQLIASEQFQKLFASAEDRSRVAAMVFRQAGAR